MVLKIPKRGESIKLSSRNIEGCIATALEKRGYKTKSTPVTAKTLNLCLALLVEVFAGKIDHYQDSEKIPMCKQLLNIWRSKQLICLSRIERKLRHGSLTLYYLRKIQTDVPLRKSCKYHRYEMQK